jgi:hypothetical protein
MAKIHVDVLVNTVCQVEDVTNPKTGAIEARKMTFIDRDTGDQVWFTANIEVCRDIGQKLMGLQDVQVANGNDMKNVIQGLGDRAKK